MAGHRRLGLNTETGISSICNYTLALNMALTNTTPSLSNFIDTWTEQLRVPVWLRHIEGAYSFLLKLTIQNNHRD